MKGLDVGYGVLCHWFDLRQGGAASTVQLAWKAFLGSRVWGRELCQAQADCSQLLLPLASHEKIRSKSYRMVCSTQPEESGNKDYDDHDADDVKNVHCTLRLRYARLQYESTMLQ
jgi:hypothetical protein